MKVLKAFLPLLVVLGGMASAHAQIVIIDSGNSWGYGSGEWVSQEELIQSCSELIYQSDRSKCYEIVRSGVFSRAGVAVCDKSIYASDRLSCLQSIRNKYYQTEAARSCGALTYASDQKKCMGIIENKYYELYELKACEQEIYASDRLSCLASFGRRSGGGYEPIPTPRPNPREPVCEVHNSSSYVTTVTRSKFENYVEKFARNENSCVVSNYYNQERSRSLVSETGRVLGSDLTEKEVSALKEYYGYDRCRILTCK